MKNLKEISTHKAIQENVVINIYQKGCEKDDILDADFIKKYPAMFKDELLWTIPISDKDDLFAIFERLEEDNRIGLAELKN